MTPTSPARGLGPHVVGQRVVVRRLLRGETGPSGGPAMSDLLGTCVSWGEAVCVVQPEAGEAVTVALADIVSGKPVPPRPSVRHRVSAREAEGHALVLWPTVATDEIGEWVLRTETRPVGRLLKQANSCLALGDPSVPMPEAAARVLDFYAAHDREPLVQVEADGAVDAWFAAAGWGQVPGGASSFQIAGVALALRACSGNGSAGVRLVEDGPRAGVEVRSDGAVVASGRAGYDGDWLGVHSLEVEPSRRRGGLGTALMQALLDWGASQGATTAWLHVQTDNVPARAFYERLGFSTHHELRYRRAPG